MQYFYIVGDDLTMCKVGLNPQQLTKWGRLQNILNVVINCTDSL